ncbi:type VI secretion system domain-containing protein [Martelella alba]|uniref:type VI secretion system domain-containing protein n=1 Tax=Martelella alba TaxID=2590451 RepID=UPI001E5AD759|nr:type VI secretion system domain-containing protein [Martelella alba]
MSTLQNLVAASQADETQRRQQAQTRTENWQSWFAPVSDASPAGGDPGYDDDFQRTREGVNKLSGIDTGLICTFAEKLLTTTAKDIPNRTAPCRPACLLKRLYQQQSWSEILEQADSEFSRGANHLWLDLQWYIHQALVKSGQDVLADIITADLKGLLRRLRLLRTAHESHTRRNR